MDGLISVDEARAYAREHWPSPVVRRPLEALLDNCPRVEADMQKMSPEEFLEKVKKIYERTEKDVECFHDRTDFLMENLLIELGYRDGVEFIRSKERWYA